MANNIASISTGSKKVLLGTGTSFTVTSYTGYSNFTVDNFLISSLNNSGNIYNSSFTGGERFYLYTTSNTRSYNSSSGVFSCYYAVTAYTNNMATNLGTIGFTPTVYLVY